MHDSRTGVDRAPELDEDGLWTFPQPLSVLGAEIGCRMTAVRLGDGSLLLHSPIRLSAALRRRLDALGPVRHVLAPNFDHYMFVPAYRAEYPEARFYATRGVQQKLPEFQFDVATEYPDTVDAWDGSLDQIYFRSSDTLHELVLFHRQTRTLITADVAFNIQSSDGMLSQLMLRLNESYRTFGPSRVCRMHITEPRLARTDVDALLALEPQRVVVGHGDVLHTGATEALRQAYDWL